MATTENNTSTQVLEPEVEATMDTKPTPTSDNEKNAAKCTCDASMPRLARRDSTDSIISLDFEHHRFPRRTVRPIPIRRHSPSPIRIHHRDTFPALNSSAHLLEQVSKRDGMADMPFPSRGSVYVTTYPFSDKDVKKWSWLFSLGVEETFLEESRGRGRDSDPYDSDAGYTTVRRSRNRSPYYDPGTVDLPSIYLSRALDTAVVPEDTADIKYLIVSQNRHRPAGSKLLVAESRKAAGIIMYYEALKGDSIMFVGAVKGLGEKKVHPKKFKKVESLEEGTRVQEEGFVGIVC